MNDMARRPFQPSRSNAARNASGQASLFGSDEADARKPDTPPPAPPAKAVEEREAERPWTVSECANTIRRLLQSQMPRTIRVVGEVSGLSQRGHWYFTLKDSDAQMSCVAWRSDAARFAFTPRDGDQVVISGSIDHWITGGRTQCYVKSLEPVGRGALQVAYERLCAELRALGYFDPDRRRSLPLLPRRIAVITSGTGAALADVRDTIRRRLPGVQLVLYDVRVQGASAADEVAAAIGRAAADSERYEIDVILVTRGGGSMEDLWAFNERVVADATHACPIPIVAAIGHESDTTIIELVADERAATPTQAAMRLVPDRLQLTEQVDYLSGRLGIAVQRQVDAGSRRTAENTRHLSQAIRHRIERHRLQLESFRVRLGRAAPDEVLQRRRRTLVDLQSRLRAASQNYLARTPDPDAARQRLHRAVRILMQRRVASLDSMARVIEALDPQQILSRGFTYTLREDGTAIRSPDDVKPGDDITTHTAGGALRSRVIP